MVLYQCSLLCGCVGSTNRSQKRVRSRLRAGLFRAGVGILSALSFMYFFVLINIALHDSEEFRHRVNTIRAVINLEESIGQERGRSLLYAAGGFNGTDLDALLQARAVVEDRTRILHDKYDRGDHYPTLDMAIGYLETFSVIRQAVDDSNTTEAEIFNFYTESNRLFQRFTLKQSFTDFKAINRVLNAVVRESILLESHGRVRGALGSVFSRGYYFDNDEILSIRTANTARESALEELNVLFEDDDTDVLIAALSGQQVRLAIRNLQIAQAIAATDPLQFSPTNKIPIEANDWFGNYTVILDGLSKIRIHLFDKLQRRTDSRLAIIITEFSIALIALVLEITACATLIMLAWPVLRLFWTMEGKARKLSSRNSTTKSLNTASLQRVSDDEVEPVSKHNSLLIAESGESEATEDSSSEAKSIEEEAEHSVDIESVPNDIEQPLPKPKRKKKKSKKPKIIESVASVDE